MTTWFTSDQHFGHARIIEYTKRPFNSVEDMDSAMIQHWNERVKPDDVVYHLGDFTLSGYKGFEYYLSKLNGTVFFVPGGHDERWISGYTKIGTDRKFTVLCSLFSTKVRNVDLVLCHYPMISWEKSTHGSYLLHGHSHGGIGCIGRSHEGSGAPSGYRMDVGVDCNNFYPVSITDILNRIDAYEGVVKV